MGRAARSGVMRGSLLALGLALAATNAAAQASTGEKAAAESLFQQGLDLMRAGNLAEACGKLEQSQSIEPGIGTSLYLAECYEKTGRTASAWALFREAASAAKAEGQIERAQAGQQRADRLEPLLSKLVIDVAPENRLPGFELRDNGKSLQPALFGLAVPVDPGEHRIEATAPGHSPWLVTVKVEATPTTTAVSVPPLAAVLEAKPVPVMPPPAPPPAPPAVPEDTSRRGSTQRTAAWIVGGAGVVAMGVGGFFGVRAVTKNNEAKDHCPGGGAACEDMQGVTLTEQAQHAATLANVLVGGGAVLALSGVVLYLTAPDDGRPAVGLVTDGRGARMTIGGAF